MKQLTIGLLGYGTVGSGVADILWRRRKELARQVGVPLQVKWVCARRFAKQKPELPQGQATADAAVVVRDPEVTMVIELIGGIEPARSLVLEAFKQGKHVITANKALLAEYGTELYAAASQARVHLWYEASVAGGIPIIKAIREALVANRFESIIGILNGTSNYILTQMAMTGKDFRTALGEAQAKGYAERDPSLDIGGGDAAHKLAILARLGFGVTIRYKDIYVEGIDRLSHLDIQYADDMGYCIKALAIAKRDKQNLELRVHPTLLPKSHLLSDVNGVFNAIHVYGDQVGSQLYSGKGAGKKPTASAVVADIVDVGRLVVSGAHALPSLNAVEPDGITGLRRMDDVQTRYYFRFMVKDLPGVMAQIAGILGRYNISIASVHQKERHRARVVPVIMMTHEAREADVRKALAAINRLRIVGGHPVVIRVEEPEAT